jgi:hypothetical protein
MTYPIERPDFPRTSGQPQAGYCKNCKAPIEDEAEGFCHLPEGHCWADWCAKQDAKNAATQAPPNGDPE